MAENSESPTVDREQNPSPGAVSVLLVEDNPVVQQVAGEMLRAIGCETHLAPDGKAALEAVAEREFDLILMDCQLPEIDGLEATRRIRASEASSRRRVPIVALAGGVEQADRETCAAAGMDDCLAKPFRLEQLEATVDRWRPRERERGPLGETKAEDASSGRTADSETDAPVLDPRIVKTIRSLDASGSFFKELVAVFVETCDRLLPRLHEAVARGDAQSASRAAHSLKSTSNSLGALRLAALCKQLETLGRARQLHRAKRLLAEIDAEQPRAREALVEESAACP